MKTAGPHAGRRGRGTHRRAAVRRRHLNLTNYKPAAPDEYDLGQESALPPISAILLRPTLIDGMQGTRGGQIQVRAATPPRPRSTAVRDAEAARALFRLSSPLILLQAEGTAEIVFGIQDSRARPE